MSENVLEQLDKVLIKAAREFIEKNKIPFVILHHYWEVPKGRTNEIENIFVGDAEKAEEQIKQLQSRFQQGR
ncbi:hypothetical protein PUATCC27989T_00491 [Phytobacter ursingii]|nr:hypothetical protein PUATCC27989T_00491 [Phytobacter ursingii]